MKHEDATCVLASFPSQADRNAEETCQSMSQSVQSSSSDFAHVACSWDEESTEVGSNKFAATLASLAWVLTTASFSSEKDFNLVRSP